ncbi:MAG: hypothetical protein GY937_27730 [bacterium]|nr:hypothetical protein [bacterium]
MTSIYRFFALTAVLALLALVPNPAPILAGCGCDHPPPAWAPIMPPFASGGQPMLINAQKDEFDVGKTYEVSFGKPGWFVAKVTVVADSKTQLRIEMPKLVNIGPVELHVTEMEGTERGDTDVYDSSLFTAMALPRRLPAGDAVIMMQELMVAVTEDGTILIPFDLRDVLDPTQFAMSLGKLPVRFGPEDVVFYNRDGVDLTLFTLAVEDATGREWGSYYGWEVEDDAGLRGLTFNSQVAEAWDKENNSDLLTYWRHEFQTYARAHQQGGSHEVSDGFHPDGSFHIDHDMLIVAISVPDQVSPGSRTVDLLASAAVTKLPIEPEEMAELTFGATVYKTENATMDALGAIFAGSDEVTLKATEESTVAVAPATVSEPELVTVSDPEPVTPTTEITITTSVYNNKRAIVKVFATASSPDVTLTATVDGVGAGAMKWNAKKDRFEYKYKTNTNLDGRTVTVTASDGATATATLK